MICVCVCVCAGYEKCILVAHDWGGGVAYGVANAYPSIVEKLIVCNCPHPAVMVKTLNSSMQQMKKSWSVYP